MKTVRFLIFLAFVCVASSCEGAKNQTWSPSTLEEFTQIEKVIYEDKDIDEVQKLFVDKKLNPNLVYSRVSENDFHTRHLFGGVINRIFNRTNNTRDEYFIEVAKLFVKHGVDVKTKDFSGATAIFYSRDFETFKFLHKLGAKVHASHKIKYTAPTGIETKEVTLLGRIFSGWKGQDGGVVDISLYLMKDNKGKNINCKVWADAWDYYDLWADEGWDDTTEEGRFRKSPVDYIESIFDYTQC